jgi:hypothetical protein
MLTVDGLRLHVTTDLDDIALGLLLDAAYEAIDAFAGTGSGSEDYPASITERITSGPGDILMLSRPAASVTSVIEHETTLDADDYELIGDQMLRRLPDGTNPSTYWRRRQYVTYTPLSDENERDRVAIALVKLDLDNSPGQQSERLGDWSVTQESTSQYEESRAAILASLSSGFIAI